MILSQQVMNSVKNFLFNNIGTRQTIVKNFIWLSTGVTASKIVRSLMMIYAARILGVEQYGIFTYVLSFAAIFNIFSDIGLTGILTRDLTKNSQKKEYLATSLCIKLVLIFVTIILVSFVSPIFSNIESAINLMYIAAFLLAFDSIRNFLYAIYRSENRMQFEAILELITEILITIVGFYIIFRISDEKLFLAGYAVASGIGMLLTMLFLRRSLVGVMRFFDKKLVPVILKSAWPFAFMGVFGVLMTNIDSVIIGSILSINDLGVYAAAQKPTTLLYMIPTFLYTSLLPFFSKFSVSDEKSKTQVLIRKSVTASLCVALPIVFCGIVVAEPLLNVVYGAEYSGAAVVFKILLLALLFVFPGTILSATLLADNKQNILLRSSVVGAVLNVSLDLILIPRFGIVGSAIATLIAQAGLNLIFFIEIGRHYKTVTFSDSFKIIISSILVALITFIMVSKSFPLLFIIPAAIGLYFIFLVAAKEEILNDFVKSLRS